MEQTDSVENLKKITNRKQFEALVKIMEENANLARGFSGFGSSKMEYGRKWREFAEILNNLGPPTRNGDGWLKVWNDLKTKIKKKLILNKKEFKTTGGGCNRIIQLSPLEETVERLLGLNKIVEPSGDVFGVRNRTPQPEACQSTYEIEIEELSMNIEQTENENRTNNREQVSIQEDICQKKMKN